MKDRSDKNDFELIVEMPEEMVKYLNNLARQTENQKRADDLSEIVVAILEVFKNNDHFDVSGICNEQELIERILKSPYKRSPS